MLSPLHIIPCFTPYGLMLRLLTAEGAERGAEDVTSQDGNFGILTASRFHDLLGQTFRISHNVILQEAWLRECCETRSLDERHEAKGEEARTRDSADR